jgi:ATP-dependent RNA helicase RhlE
LSSLSIPSPPSASSDPVRSSFDDLGLVPSLLAAVRRAGYLHPTPVQAAAIPSALAGRDVLGCAQTGTGKTAAFVLPILQRLLGTPTPRDRRPFVRALVLSPTRELALQIAESVQTYGHGAGLRHVAIFGGVGQGPQVDALRRGVDVLVATPGRLIDLMEQRCVDLSQIEVLVLDEADRMLDQGFIPAIRRIVAKVPRKRQTLFFSATMPDELRPLVAQMLVDPAHVAVTPVASTPDRVDQAVYMVQQHDKRALLHHLLDRGEVTRALVFTRTKHGADRVARQLGEAAAIHGNKSQNARVRALEGFRTGEIRVLVATDVAARGIDIDDVSHVINYDLPVDPEAYVHRIGRTARAGAAGKALSLCTPEERGQLASIERLIQRRVPVVGDHPFVNGSSAPAPSPARSSRPASPGRSSRPQSAPAPSRAAAPSRPSGTATPARPSSPSALPRPSRSFGPRRGRR